MTRESVNPMKRDIVKEKAVGRTARVSRTVAEARCDAPGHKHQPDWRSLWTADTGGDGIIDIWCSSCGQSGSTQLAPKDIDWGDGEYEGCRGPRPRVPTPARKDVRQLLRPGDWFAYDTGGYSDGDILYAQVLAVEPHFAPGVDRVGDDLGGYKVSVHCACDPEQGTPDGAVDFYGFDYVDYSSCVRLSPAQARQAEQAGWPRERAFVRDVLGIRVPGDDADDSQPTDGGRAPPRF